MFKKILLATDGSIASEKAMVLALELGAIHSAQVMALYVIDPYPFIGIGLMNPMGYAAYWDSGKQHAAAIHENFMQQAKELAPSVPIECLLLEGGQASEGILKVAQEKDCDLIVMGSHGLGGLGRMVLGSVATQVLHQANIPVLISK